ncbi:hypothetical protein [Pseudocitrobacter corydidari]|uniref:Flagellar protein FliT n=1 Tax=Pseudocitrobacter corydidari TaxID=2891570 RepID=A0ABY3S769_9ENTR|nr:hypothetical protein [Pseudocitrobacter corydidari]UGS41812.1 hypothetical protein G163CM_25290 [Pseudocitrobacter corydidari]
MSYLSSLQTLAQTLRQVTADHQWPAVQRVDGEIAALLGEIQGETLDNNEQQALATLKRIHQQAREYCMGQLEIVEAKMALSVRNREGATAYAAFMDAEDLR